MRLFPTFVTSIADGLPVFAIIEPDAKVKGQSIKAAMLVNAYTKQSYTSDKMAHTQDIINKSRVLWANPNNEKTQAWIDATRLLLPSSAKPGFNVRVTQRGESVNPPNLETPVETVSDIRMIFNGKFELINALKERQYLDKHGKANAFQRNSNTQAKAQGQAQADTTSDVANSRQDRERLSDYGADRALRKGEIRNEFHNALTKQEWALYYKKVDNAKQFVSDLFQPGDTTQLLINDKLLRMEMQENGEFNVVDSIQALNDDATSALYENYSDFGGDYGREALERWASTFEDDAGTSLFKAYDRQRGGYVRILDRSDVGEKRASGLSDGESERDGQGSIQENARDRSKVQRVTEPETISDVRDIYTGKGEGHNGVMNSRGMTTDEYMALDFSKNRILQESSMVSYIFLAQWKNWCYYVS